MKAFQKYVMRSQPKVSVQKVKSVSSELVILLVTKEVLTATWLRWFPSTVGLYPWSYLASFSSMVIIPITRN